VRGRIIYLSRVPRRAPTEPPFEFRDDGSAAVSAHLAALGAEAGRSGRASRRKEQGSHYTPPALVGWILDRAMDGRAAPLRVLDPACGAGNFLVAAAERLVANGVSARDALAERIYGIDIDATAIELCRARLLALLPAGTPPTERARIEASLRAHVVAGDALERTIAEITGVSGFDLIVGNPPFLNQLEVATTASRDRAARIRARTGGVVAGYSDLSSAFLLEAVRHASASGVVGFVMPQSLLAAADARTMRAWIAANARVRALWTADDRIFEDAAVRVCAIVASNERPAGAFELAFGADFSASPAVECARIGAEPWSALFASARGVPTIEVLGRPALASVAHATADFRDQFYGLRGAIVDRVDADDARFPKLVSTRHVDLAHCAWGERPVRVLFERHAAPRADRAMLERDAKMAAWIHARLVPKVLVATQTKVLEAVVDEQGAWLPVVPLLTAAPREGADVDLWMLAAAIASPVATAEAARIAYGAALGAGAIKLSAKQLMALPLPGDRAAWTESARLFREASSARNARMRDGALRAFAEASCRSHRLDLDATKRVLAFWSARAFGVRPKTTTPA
jgi:methylase of polypeptide subunit release factors